jgi:rhodanese-related sulfurtransferase
MASMAKHGMTRAERAREQDPRSVPWPVDGEADLVVVDTTWGELQPLQAAPGVRTLGEIELVQLVDQGAVLVDCRTRGSFGGRTLPGSVLVPHDEIVDRRGELDPGGLSILFCNGPQCPQSPDAIRRLLQAGYPAEALAYYRGGLHDWVTMALPTQPRED